MHAAASQAAPHAASLPHLLLCVDVPKHALPVAAAALGAHPRPPAGRAGHAPIHNVLLPEAGIRVLQEAPVHQVSCLLHEGFKVHAVHQAVCQLTLLGLVWVKNMQRPAVNE